MSEIKISKVSSIKPVEPAGASPQEFSPREGQVYTARVKGFVDGTALVSINDRFLLSLSDLAVKTGESVLLELIKREADGKLIFKMATGDNAAGRSLEASSKGVADILKTIGVDAKIPYSQNVLESHLNFGLRLDARSIERAASALNKFLESFAADSPGDPSAPAGLQEDASPQIKSQAAGGAAASLLKPGVDIQMLSDAVVLLNKSNISFGPASLQLAASLLEKLRGGLDFNSLFSSRHSLLASELAAVLPQLEGLNKKAALTAARLLGYLKSSDASGTGAAGLKITTAFSRLVSEGAIPSENKSVSALKDLFTLIGELDKTGRGGDNADNSFKSVALNQLRENIFALLENRALIELYSVISGSELFKIPIDYEGENGEALCEIEREDGRVSAVDIYLTLSKLDTIRINVKKKETAAGIYIFVKNKAIKDYINSKYAENKELLDSAMKSQYYFTVVVGEKIDFMPPIIRCRVSGIPQTTLDISA